jgi:antirestriction protein ArdC
MLASCNLREANMDAKPDVRQDITTRVLAYLEEGTVPWRKAWTSGSSRPTNAKTQKQYAGINSLILGMAMFDNANYASDNRFITGAQAYEMGLLIRKGEHAAARIIRMVEVNRRQANKVTDGEVVAEEDGKYLVMKTYAVFHASQLQPPGLPPIVKDTTDVTPVAAVGSIVNAMKATGLKIAEGPFDPVYLPRLDLIRMPTMASFKGADADDVAANYYGTLLHEISHAVGAPKRMARFGLSQMSLQERAMEELVAEWSAALLCSGVPGIKLGEDHIQQHSAYLSSWMQVLKEDKSAIFRAAAAAQRTCDYIDQRVTPEVAPVAVAPDAPVVNEAAMQFAVVQPKTAPR